MQPRTQRLIERLNDPSLIELPHRFFDDERHFVRRSTLAQLTRIEALRWRVLHAYRAISRRRAAVMREIVPHGAAFIPVDRLNSGVTAMNGGRPRRLVVRRSEDGVGISAQFDDDYWRHQPTKMTAASSALGELAQIGDLRDWETECDRRVAAIAPEQLELGRRYSELEARTYALGMRLGRLNSLIEMAVRSLGLVKKDSYYSPKRLVSVQINGRSYPFEVEGSWVKGCMEYWPQIGEEQVVVVPERFVLDESLLGKDSEAVLTRLGEPDRYAELPKDLALEEKALGGRIWFYGDRGVVVSRHDVVVKLV